MGAKTRVYNEGDRLPGTNYRLERVLGAGGFGVAYEALEIEIELRVVIKVVYPEIAAARRYSRKQLQREARALARLKEKTENVVHVLGVGVTRDEHRLPFVIMEYLEGQTVGQLVRRCIKSGQVLPVAAVLTILIDLSQALWAAHQLGFVHRDIKPENVFLQMKTDAFSGRACIVKLLDFGIAHVTGDDRAGRGFVGTVAYGAPEQHRIEPVTAQTDLYGLGLLAFELLTLRRPFDDPAGGRDTRGIVDSHLYRTPPRVSASREVPQALDDLVAACLAKAPSARPPDAFFVARALHETQRSLDAGALPRASLLAAVSSHEDAARPAPSPPLVVDVTGSLDAFSRTSEAPSLDESSQVFFLPPAETLDEPSPHHDVAIAESRPNEPPDALPRTSGVGRQSGTTQEIPELVAIARRLVGGTRVPSTSAQGSDLPADAPSAPSPLEVSAATSVAATPRSAPGTRAAHKVEVFLDDRHDDIYADSPFENDPSSSSSSTRPVSASDDERVPIVHADISSSARPRPRPNDGASRRPSTMAERIPPWLPVSVILALGSIITAAILVSPPPPPRSGPASALPITTATLRTPPASSGRRLLHADAGSAVHGVVRVQGASNDASAPSAR